MIDPQTLWTVDLAYTNGPLTDVGLYGDITYHPNLLVDHSGQVLREYANEGGTWTLGTDYIRRDGQLLAAETRLGRRYFHLDHLGTPRLITNSVGYQKAYHVYYPFGEEATAFNQDGERMKFTGHERDLASGEGATSTPMYLEIQSGTPTQMERWRETVSTTGVIVNNSSEVVWVAGDV